MRLFKIPKTNARRVLDIVPSASIGRRTINLDYQLLGVHPTLWLERMINPIFTEIMQLSYVSYWLMIPLSCGLLFIQGKVNEFHKLLLGICIAFYISFLIFIIFPAAGPRFVMASQQSLDLKGILLTDFFRIFVNETGLRGGCFPSSHIAVAVVILKFFSAHP